LHHFQTLLSIPEKGFLYAVKSGRLSLFMVLYNLKNMEILVEVPQEILDGIARGVELEYK